MKELVLVGIDVQRRVEEGRKLLPDRYRATTALGCRAHEDDGVAELQALALIAIENVRRGRHRPILCAAVDPPRPRYAGRGWIAVLLLSMPSRSATRRSDTPSLPPEQRRVVASQPTRALASAVHASRGMPS